MRRYLGISAYYHDSAAALVADGAIVAAAQEERFTRRKHDAAFPADAIRYCLDATELTLADVDGVVFYDKPWLKFERLLESYLANAPRGFKSFLAAMPIWLREKLYLKNLLRTELARLSGLDKGALPPLMFTEHHQAHAASAFYPSPYADAAVLCMDGVGEWATTSAWRGRDSELSPLWEIDFPHSLGLLYSAFTYYTGFRVNSGEYKLMGLAPYGEPRYVDRIRDHLIDLREDGSFRLDMRYFNFVTGLTMTNDRFHRLFEGGPREPESALGQREMDLARSIQVVTEEVVLRLAAALHRDTGARHLCMAGGVALNCVANGRVLKEGPFDDVWVQPAAGDAGGAPGAALAAWHLGRSDDDGDRILETGARGPDAMAGTYLGPSYDDDAVRAYLDDNGLPHETLPDERLFDHVADRLAEGQVVGWFQGAMEFGPRALGNRSILGDPRDRAMQKTMNLKIKYRESFRPFAPAVLAERVSEVFDLDRPSPYMLVTAPVVDALRVDVNGDGAAGLDKLALVRSHLPAITHVDYSARVQTVHRETNPRFHRLIDAFDRRTGVPVLVNTSFNVRGEPIVCTPQDAYRCFMNTEMDCLVVGNIVLDKAAQPAAHQPPRGQAAFPLD